MFSRFRFNIRQKDPFPGCIFIGQYDLPPIIARDEWRNRGFGNPKPVGNLHRPVFSQLAKYLLSQETTLTTFVATPRHSHTHTTYKMACIASSFTGSVAALKASKVQVRARAHHRARRRARAAPTPAFFSRGIPRHLSRSRPPFPSYLERI